MDEAAESPAAPWPTSPPVVRHIEPGVMARLHFFALQSALSLTGRLFAGRGVHRVTVGLGRIFGRGHRAVFEVFGSRLLEVSLSDRYWIPHLLWFRSYEPEVGYVLSRVLGPETCFVDGGANVGWWSIFASTRIPFPDRILAIEASPTMFRRLERNCRLNDGTFRCLEAAIWDTTGERVEILSHPDRHGSSSVNRDQPWRGYRAEPTVTVTVGDAVARHTAADAGNIVVKLDVEGAETRALAGLPLRRLSLLVYEENGLGSELVTGAVLARGLRVFACDRSLRIVEIDSVGAARAMLPENPVLGCNFYACPEGSPALRVLEPLTGQPPPVS